eukprot:scaffold1274_cov142-Isochrysis_galbana.AAC.1
MSEVGECLVYALSKGTPPVGPWRGVCVSARDIPRERIAPGLRCSVGAAERSSALRHFLLRGGWYPKNKRKR